MKKATIEKSAQEGVSAQQLEKINKYTRRALGEKELYVFSLILCDNEVDRDGERFPAASLQTLAKMFVGKTGVFDHSPKGENQMARIFDTAIEEDKTRVTESGEPYNALRAWAYMVRCDKNADLILEIDAGIKKEVSVGCAVECVECSVCGADMRMRPCAHEKGKRYGGIICRHELVNPTDAYEWSFVAVPAQRLAGVTKAAGGDLVKSLECGGAVTLDKGQAQALATRLRELEARGQRRAEELRRKLLATATIALPTLDTSVLRQVADMMDEGQLEAMCKGFEKASPVFTQLASGVEGKTQTNQAFYI